MPTTDQTIDPTASTYQGLTKAFSFFNDKLFDGKLPSCLITMQRKQGAFGYFAGARFGTRDKSEVTDEIALNPAHFQVRSTREILSTLVHEMCHLEQHHYGTPSRSTYHNKEWGKMMRAVGLIPSSTGAPGGTQTGQKVSHYIEEGGRFERACASLEKAGVDVRYVEIWDEAKRAKKAASKTKYTCPDCGTNAWAKPDTKIDCGECDIRMEPEQ